MGNELSQEEENELLEEAYSMSLEDPGADKYFNSGTAAPNCQPKHTKKASDENIDLTNSDLDAEERRRRQQMSAKEQQKKMGYIQMAKLGYQELVNLIIRPPRAEYKVGRFQVVAKAILKLFIENLPLSFFFFFFGF